MKRVLQTLLALLFLFLVANDSVFAGEYTIEPYSTKHLIPYGGIPEPPAAVPLTDIFQVPPGANSSILGDKKKVEVTPDAQSQKGAIFSTASNLIDLNSSFRAKMYVYLGNKGTAAADGMTFVMHNDQAALTNFDKVLGENLGVWAQSGSYNIINEKGPRRALKNSLAIEFDPYYNGEYMDKLVKFNIEKPDEKLENGHIAYNFPHQRGAYSGAIHQSDPNTTVLIHLKTQIANKPLSDNTWHPFVIEWDEKTKTLTYQFDQYTPVKIENIDVNTIFGTNQVYWGFTGSTGQIWAHQMVAFAEVPGLVNLVENITVTPNNTVNWGQKSTVTMNYKYVGGKQNLSKPKVSLGLDEALVYVPGTLKVNDVITDDAVWVNNKKLDLAISELSLANPTAKITFDVQANKVSADTQALISYSMIAENYIGTVKTTPITVKAPKLEITQKTNALTISLKELTDYRKLTPEEISADIQKKLGVTAIDTVTNSIDGIGYIGYLSDGVTTISEWIQAATTKSGSKTGYKYKAGYYGATSNATDAFITGELTIQPIDLVISQSLSELVFTAGELEAYKLLSNDEIEADIRTRLGISAVDQTVGNSDGITFNGFIKGTNDDLLGDAVKGASFGTAINYYFVAQKDGVISVPVEGIIRVTGGVINIESFAAQSSFSTTELGSTTKLVPRDTLTWGLVIKDTRITGSPWKLSATATKLRTTDNKILDGGIVFVDEQGEATPLDETTATVLYSGTKTSQTTNVVEKWTSNSGLLLKLNTGNYAGNYSGSVNWILSDVP